MNAPALVVIVKGNKWRKSGVCVCVCLSRDEYEYQAEDVQRSPEPNEKQMNMWPRMLRLPSGGWRGLSQGGSDGGSRSYREHCLQPKCQQTPACVCVCEYDMLTTALKWLLCGLKPNETSQHSQSCHGSTCTYAHILAHTSPCVCVCVCASLCSSLAAAFFNFMVYRWSAFDRK